MTYHSIKRARKRIGIGRVTAFKRFEDAFYIGKRANELSGRCAEYLLSRSSENKEAVYYNGFCYIFSHVGVCITLYQVPKWFGGKRFFIRKEIVRNPKKYCLRYMNEIIE